MAMASTLPSLLSTLTESLESASSSLPEPDTLTPPVDGISLLDTKNDILLSYLQNLVFLIIFKLRNQYQSHESQSEDGGGSQDIGDQVTKKLIELRVYLEKGVRPLESRLRYQLDKLLLAASEADTTATKSGTAGAAGANGLKTLNASDDDLDIDSGPPPNISDLSHRPNPSAFARPSIDDSTAAQETSGLYRPPRITPTALPTTERKQAKTSKPRHSQTLDAFIREEMGDAPVAEPSIGAGNGLRGKDREREEERKGYEEQRLVRLPGEKKKKRDQRRGEDLSGGLSGLGEVDFGSSKGRSRKRERDGGEGERIGERWEKRVKRGVGRKRR